MYSDTTYPTPNHNRLYVESSTDGDNLAISTSSPSAPFTATTLQLSSPSQSSVSPSKLKETQLYKTEYCRNWTELGDCSRYAHGDTELRKISRHSRYKTKICRAYHLEGECLYGSRCTFIHSNTKDQSAAQNSMEIGINKAFVDSSSFSKSDGHKIRQHSRFFSPNNNDEPTPTPLHGRPLSTVSTELQCKKIWDSKLGLFIRHSLDHPTCINDGLQNTIVGYSTSSVDLNDRSSYQPSHPSVFDSPCFSPSSTASSLSSTKTVEAHQTPCINSYDNITTLDIMYDSSWTTTTAGYSNTIKSRDCVVGLSSFNASSGQISSLFNT